MKFQDAYFYVVNKTVQCTIHHDLSSINKEKKGFKSKVKKIKQIDESNEKTDK